MTQHVEAVYENGVLRPLEPVLLEEQQRVTVVITDGPEAARRSYLDVPYMEALRWEVEALDRIPSREEILRITSKDADSWSDAAIAEREGHF
jgi:predicted DNA-binding antitoxin AbrB/MazE fold protein/predicted nucleic acid-binding protein